jgi:hypothetical protein
LSHGRRNPAIQGRKRKRPERSDVVAELAEKLPYYAERHFVGLAFKNGNARDRREIAGASFVGSSGVTNGFC